LRSDLTYLRRESKHSLAFELCLNVQICSRSIFMRYNVARKVARTTRVLVTITRVPTSVLYHSMSRCTCSSLRIKQDKKGVFLSSQYFSYYAREDRGQIKVRIPFFEVHAEKNVPV
jgi:hypothetical protein